MSMRAQVPPPRLWPGTRNLSALSSSAHQVYSSPSRLADLRHSCRRCAATRTHVAEIRAACTGASFRVPARPVYRSRSRSGHLASGDWVSHPSMQPVVGSTMARNSRMACLWSSSDGFGGPPMPNPYSLFGPLSHV
jgi:hypothetical protein